MQTYMHARTNHIYRKAMLLQEANDLFSRLGLGAMPQVLLNGIPMKQAELDGDQFEEALVTGIMRMTGELQKAVHAVSLKSNNSKVYCFYRK